MAARAWCCLGCKTELGRIKNAPDRKRLGQLHLHRATAQALTRDPMTGGERIRCKKCQRERIFIGLVLR